jgi:hypothetical protein
VQTSSRKITPPPPRAQFQKHRGSDIEPPAAGALAAQPANVVRLPEERKS